MEDIVTCYLMKTILKEDSFLSQDSLDYFRDYVDGDLLHLMFDTYELTLTNDQIHIIRQEILQFIGISGIVGMSARLLNANLDSILAIDNRHIYERNIYSINIMRHYNIFKFRKLGLDLMRLYNNLRGESNGKYVIDYESKLDQYLFFTSDYKVYMLSSDMRTRFEYYLCWNDGQNTHTNDQILEMLNNKFNGFYFFIENLNGVNILTFVPTNGKYIKLFYKVEVFLISMDITYSRAPLIT